MPPLHISKALCMLLPQLQRYISTTQSHGTRSRGSQKCCSTGVTSKGPMVAGEPQEESQEHPTCLVRQLEEPAPRDVDIIVGTIAVVVQGLAPHLYRPAQLIHLLLQPAMRGDARNAPRYGGRGILSKERLICQCTMQETPFTCTRLWSAPPIFSSTSTSSWLSSSTCGREGLWWKPGQTPIFQ